MEIGLQISEKWCCPGDYNSGRESTPNDLTSTSTTNVLQPHQHREKMTSDALPIIVATQPFTVIVCDCNPILCRIFQCLKKYYWKEYNLLEFLSGNLVTGTYDRSTFSGDQFNLIYSIIACYFCSYLLYILKGAKMCRYEGLPSQPQK